MPREATLFEMAGGNPLEGYFLLKSNGGNIPPTWLDRARESRVARQEELATVLREGDWGDITRLREWEEYYRKECFYYGIRILFELERTGHTKL